MKYTDDEETIGRLIRSAYRPASLPAAVKEIIRGDIMNELDNDSKRIMKPWARPRLMVPILASIASGLIAYGCWISMALA
jgi:hypothetical protein